MKEESFQIPNYILATKNQRLLHFIIDLTIIHLLSFVILYFFGFIKYNANYPNLSDWIATFDNVENFLYKSIIWFFYYGLCETWLSRTFAKYVTNTIVVLKDGSKPKVMTILGRTLLRLVPFEALTFLRGRKSGLHDSHSHTFVVKVNQLQTALKTIMNGKLYRFNTHDIRK